MSRRKNDAFPEDPVVQEVRQIREKLWKEGGGTAAGLMKVLERIVPSQEEPQARRGASPRGKKNRAIPLDPVVEEIRSYRRKLWMESGQNVEKYVELIQRKAANNSGASGSGKRS
jgi:hypothetical protein